MENFPESEIDIKTLPLIIETNFPGRWRETEACLATVATLFIEDVTNPMALNLVGSPSSTKTTILGFFKNTKELVYFTDKFTPKSFVSCFANAKAERLAKIDLLPLIKDKVLIVPELAPLFRARADDLTENFSILTRVFDGEGLWVNSGTTGGRGYQGDYMFCWLGGTTPIDHTAWKTMATLGSRMFFLAMNEEKRTPQDLVNNNNGSVKFKDKVKECRLSVDIFLKKLLAQGAIRSINWDSKSDDPKAVEHIAKLAILLSYLRGTLQIWTEGQGETENYVHRTPIIELPDRANSILYNFARGRALLYGRNYIIIDDIKMVKDIAFCSMPNDRRQLFQTLIDNIGIVGTSTIDDALRCSPKVAKGLMETFVVLGIAEDATLDWNMSTPGAGSDEKAIRLKEETASWLFSDDFAAILSNDKPPQNDDVIC